MGLMPDVFWSLTWNDYHRLSEGFHHRQELEWERTRYIAAMVFNANSTQSKTPQQLVPLNLDKKRKETKATTTSEDVARIMENFNKRKQLNNGE